MNSDLTYESFLNTFLKENKKELKNKGFDCTVNIFLEENHFLNPILQTNHLEKDIFLTVEDNFNEKDPEKKEKRESEERKNSHLRVDQNDLKRVLGAIFLGSEIFKQFYHPSHQLERDLLKGVYELKGYDTFYLLETEIFRKVFFYLKKNEINVPSFFKQIENDQSNLLKIITDFNLTESNIFKNEEDFNFLEEVIFPKLIKKINKQKKIRIWIVGVGSGQEFFNYILPFLNYAESKKIDLRKFQIAVNDLVSLSMEFRTMPFLNRSDHFMIPKKYRKFLKENKEKNRFYLKSDPDFQFFISDKSCFLRSQGFFNTNLLIFNNIFEVYKNKYKEKFLNKALTRLIDEGLIVTNEIIIDEDAFKFFKDQSTYFKQNNLIKAIEVKKKLKQSNLFLFNEENSIESMEQVLYKEKESMRLANERLKASQAAIRRYNIDPKNIGEATQKIKKDLQEVKGFSQLKEENKELREMLKGLEKSYALTYKEQLLNHRKMEEANLKLEDLKNNLVKNLVNKTEELEKLNKVLSQFEKDRTFFYSKLSHDLRTPLNSVLGFSDVAMEGINDLESEQIYEYLNYINKSGKSLLNLVNSIYEFTKVDLEKLKIVNENFSTQQFLDELQALHENNCVIKGLRFELNKGANLPPYLKADHSKMRQVLDNLIDNAVKFTDEGLVSLEVQAYFYAGKEDQLDLVFEVSDTGIGIDTDKMKQIEKEFSNPLEEGNLGEKGSGIGLYISKKIVEKMNGEIEISSKKGRGTLFTVVFKDVFKGEIEVLEDDSLSSDFLGQEVIILDKSQSGRILLMTYLEGTNLKIETAQNQKELYQKVKRTNPSLILFDVSLPMEEKLETILEIKEDEKYKDIPIILVSSVAIPEDISTNFQGVLQKPISKKFLLNEFKKHLKFKKDRKEEKSEKSDKSSDLPKDLGEKTSGNKIQVFPEIVGLDFNPEEVKLIKHLVVDLTYFLKYMDINVLEEKLLSYKKSIEGTELSHTKEWVEWVTILSSQFEVDKLKVTIEDAVAKIESYILKEAKSYTNKKAS